MGRESSSVELMRISALGYAIVQLVMLMVAAFVKIYTSESANAGISLHTFSKWVFIFLSISTLFYMYVLYSGMKARRSVVDKEEYVELHKTISAEISRKFINIANAVKGVVFWEIDNTGKITFISDGISGITGKTSYDLIGSNILDIVSSDWKDRFLKDYESAINNPRVKTPFLMKCENKDGDVRYFKVHPVEKMVIGRNITRVYGYLLDNTAEVVEMQRKEREGVFFKDLVNDAGEMIWVTDNKGVVIFANEPTKEKFSDDFVGGNMSDWLLNGSKVGIRRFFSKYNKKYGKKRSYKEELCKHPKQMLLVFRGKDGNRMILSSFVTKLFENGKFSGIKSTSVEVTENFTGIFDSIRKSNEIAQGLNDKMAEIDAINNELQSASVN